MAWVGPIAKIVRRHPSGMRRWAIAVALFAAGLLVRLALEPWLSPIAFLTFYPAIIATTLICGWRQGVLVVLLSMAAGWYLFLEPRGSFAFDGARTPVILASFLVVALFQVALVAALAEVVSGSTRCRPCRPTCSASCSTASPTTCSSSPRR